MSKWISFPKLTVIYLLLLHGTVNAQTLQYSYDAAGNRISKTLIVAMSHTPKTGDERISSIGFRNAVQPNTYSTHGVIDFKIEDFDSKKKYKISVYSINGIDVTSVVPQTETTTIDLSNLQRGIYILSVTTDGETQTFKITKK